MRHSRNRPELSLGRRIRFGGLYAVRFMVAVLVGALFALGVGASGARPAAADHVTISGFDAAYDPAMRVLVPNFERVYPNITVNFTNPGGASSLFQLEPTELAAGNAPDLLQTYSGCGTLISVCVLAKVGDLAPLVQEPWVRRSLPSVTSADKHGAALYAFSPLVSLVGVFTNDDLFKKLGLKVPETFSQLLDLCRKAKADGTTALIIAGGNPTNVTDLVDDLAVANVYANDPHWNAQRKAGTVTFAGTPGWHTALQEIVDMNSAGCFEPGFLGANAYPEFAQGQGLMLSVMSDQKAVIDLNNPQFHYSFRPFPGGANPTQTMTTLHLAVSLSVNAHSSAQNQAAAQTFIDFVARPKQNALVAQILGGLTQYEFLKQQLPPFMSAMAPVFKQHAYVVDPTQSWWNADVLLTLRQDGVGLFTGQETPDSILQALDAAWKQGPS
jgi:raffinose/stachyose/melibiose transport system substrate-binding protein